jgi:hypothetical protein
LILLTFRQASVKHPAWISRSGHQTYKRFFDSLHGQSIAPSPCCCKVCDPASAESQPQAISGDKSPIHAPLSLRARYSANAGQHT